MLGAITATKAREGLATFTPENPYTGEPLTSDLSGAAITITFLAPESKDGERAVAKALLRLERQGATPKAKPKTPDQVLAKAADSRATKAALFAALTQDWAHVDVDGALAECTTGAAEALYLSAPWLIDQIDRFFADGQNFMPAPETT